jgi:hypothetical protein
VVPHPRRPGASSDGQLGSPFAATGLSRSRRVTAALRAALRLVVDHRLRNQPSLVLGHLTRIPKRAGDTPRPNLPHVTQVGMRILRGRPFEWRSSGPYATPRSPTMTWGAAISRPRVTSPIHRVARTSAISPDALAIPSRDEAHPGVRSGYCYHSAPRLSSSATPPFERSSRKGTGAVLSSSSDGVNRRR